MQTAQWIESNTHLVLMLGNRSRRVGGNSDHLFRTGQRACKPPVGMSHMRPHPAISPADEIGGEHSQHGLDLDARSTATHQMLDFEVLHREDSLLKAQGNSLCRGCDYRICWWC